MLRVPSAGVFLHRFPNGIGRTTSNLTSWSWSTAPKRQGFWGVLGRKKLVMNVVPVVFLAR